MSTLQKPYRLTHWVGGEPIVDPASSCLPNINPATGETIGEVPIATAHVIDQAVQAAQQAFSSWSALPAEERSHWLNRLADAIESDSDALALAETTDSGKPLWLSQKMDIPRAASNFRFFAAAATQFASESHSGPSSIDYTLRQPLGVVGCISPWNLPIYLFTWKIAPALAAGNTVVAKPSEVTPSTAYLLGALMKRIGFPKGVLNIVQGDGPTTGESIVIHPQIKAISFTGSTRAGQRIASLLAPQLKKYSLELGGKNAAVIFSDANLDHAVKETVRSAFTNQGEICLCTSRILVEQSIYDRFRSAFVERVKQLTVGDPLDDSSKQGALVSSSHFEKVRQCVDRARQEGGKILIGGEPFAAAGSCAMGFFYKPTVIEGLGPDTQTNQEEIFGPVATLQPFQNETQAIELANHSGYGLAATVWTTDLQKAHRVATSIQAGIVWVNSWLYRDLRTPFGGVKNSGLGREGGWEAMRFFTEPKNISIRF
ncbi:MAG: aldehyde dehydrogenase [Bacteroidetes bacterium]|nr:aldehyde dehydrogenase [Bacteroidota bacterium]